MITTIRIEGETSSIVKSVQDLEPLEFVRVFNGGSRVLELMRTSKSDAFVYMKTDSVRSGDCWSNWTRGVGPYFITAPYAKGSKVTWEVE